MKQRGAGTGVSHARFVEILERLEHAFDAPIHRVIVSGRDHRDAHLPELGRDRFRKYWPTAHSTLLKPTVFCRRRAFELGGVEQVALQICEPSIGALK